MRWWVLGLLIAMACPALAADYDDSWLRGSQVIGAAPTPPPRLYRIWAGVYGGAQVGEDFDGVDFRQVPSTPIQSAIAQDAILTALAAPAAGMPALPQVNTRGLSYGGFIGYNWQIDDVVFGAELNINRSSLHQTAVNSATRGYWVNNGGIPIRHVALHEFAGRHRHVRLLHDARAPGLGVRKLLALCRRRRRLRAGRQLDKGRHRLQRRVRQYVHADVPIDGPQRRPRTRRSAGIIPSPMSAMANTSSGSTLPWAWTTCSPGMFSCAANWNTSTSNIRAISG